MTEEIWKDIKGYEGKYQVSNLGRVKSVKRKRFSRVYGGTIAVMTVPERILKQWKRSTYFLVDLWKNKKRDVRSVHYLVYETFVGKIPTKKQIHHKDENKYNNNVENLVCLSCVEHLRLHNKGVFKGKISPQTRRQANIKAWITRKNKYKFDERNKKIYNDKQSGMKLRELSEKYGICERQILTVIRSIKDADRKE